MSDGTCWKKQCEKLANIESLVDLREKARRDIFRNSEKDEEKVKESGEYYRKVFIEMQKYPLMRYRFLKTIPTLGLNVQELSREEVEKNRSTKKKRVFGGFSFNAAEGYEEEEDATMELEDDDEVSKMDADEKENVSKICSNNKNEPRTAR